MFARNKLVFSLFLASIAIVQLVNCDCSTNVSRKSFPKDFVFGTASSAYQYEGAVKEDGRGPSVWDTFAHRFGKVIDFSNADVAVDHYHRYPEDIKLIKDMGLSAYRFSISWTRIFPNGTGQINQAGVDHYNNLINALLANGIQPYVTMYHWDTPQALEDAYKGWLSPQIINDFGAYAETLYQKFGDRVKHWITLNEPHTVASQGYDIGIFAPGRCSILLHLYCRAGNSATEPYIVAHNLILAHATAVKIYRDKYQKKQGGTIGAALDTMWFEPETNTTENIEAAQRAVDFQLGWKLPPKELLRARDRTGELARCLKIAKTFYSRKLFHHIKAIITADAVLPQLHFLILYGVGGPTSRPFGRTCNSCCSRTSEEVMFWK